MKIEGRLRKELKCGHCSPHKGHNRKKKRKYTSWKELRDKQSNP